MNNRLLDAKEILRLYKESFKESFDYDTAKLIIKSIDKFIYVNNQYLISNNPIISKKKLNSLLLELIRIGEELRPSVELRAKEEKDEEAINYCYTLGFVEEKYTEAKKYIYPKTTMDVLDLTKYNLYKENNRSEEYYSILTKIKLLNELLQLHIEENVKSFLPKEEYMQIKGRHVDSKNYYLDFIILSNLVKNDIINFNGSEDNLFDLNQEYKEVYDLFTIYCEHENTKNR